MEGLRKRSRAGRGERGAVLIEFALVFPILFMFLMGIASGGVAYNQKQQITFATREGARYAATIAADQVFTSGTWASNVRDIVVERSAGDLGGSGTSVCVSLVQGSPAVVYGVTPTVQGNFTTTADGSPCIAGQTYPITAKDNGRRVQIAVQRPGSIQLVFFSEIKFAMTSTATAKSESQT